MLCNGHVDNIAEVRLLDFFTAVTYVIVIKWKFYKKKNSTLKKALGHPAILLIYVFRKNKNYPQKHFNSYFKLKLNGNTLA